MKQIIIPNVLPNPRRVIADLAIKLNCDIHDLIGFPYVENGRVQYAQPKFLTDAILNVK